MRLDVKMMKYIALSLLLVLTACGDVSDGGVFTSGPKDVSHYPKVPWKGVKVGKPYKINGKWYSPRYDPSYEETGIASWYGPGFHGRLTANGEKYNQNGYTAAHTTLPLPSIVRVTNLQNGRAMNVRLNDRGPFHGGRIIDLSKAAADKLGVIGGGVAKVRVQYLPKETEQYISSKGKNGAATKFSSGFADYHIANPAAPKQVRQDIKSLPIDSQGKQTSAPLRGIEVSNLPDITPKQVESLEAPWLVQVASYADTVNAQGMMSKLNSIGEPMLQTVSVKGQPYYRVILKPNSQNDNQSEMLSQLESRFGIDDAKVITQ